MIFSQSITEGVHFTPGPKPNLPWVDTVPGSLGLDDLRQQFSKPLFILMTVVGLVLLIACANVANLLLARATARQKKLAVRLALGAGRGRLVRQLLTESMLLATAGGVLGLILAEWGSRFLVALISRGDNPVVLNVHSDARVFGFAAAACLLTGLLFGLAPALRGTRVDLTPSLKRNAGSRGSRGLRFGLAKSLVVTQMGLSLVLLVGAGLFVRTLVNLEDVDVGFNRNNLLLFGIDPSQGGYKGTRLAHLCDQIQQHIAALPGVSSATLSLHPLLGQHIRTNSISVSGYTPYTNEDMDVHVLPVGTRFFGTMQIPLLLGRGLGPQDNEKSPKVAVINEAFKRKYLANQNPIGKQFTFGDARSPRTEIVGVAGDAKYTELREDIPATVYQPYRQTLDTITSMHFEVRTARSPLVMAPAVRRIVRDLDRALPVYDLKTQNQQVDETLLQERLFAKLSSFFGMLALLLASVGLYGVLSYAIVRRTGEIGVRMALGAQRGNILAMILRETSLLMLLGLALGIPAALAAARLASSQVADSLYGVKATDATNTLLAALLLAAVALLAAYMPARRASWVDPMVALRYE